jgi:hypothetical protein
MKETFAVLVGRGEYVCPHCWVQGEKVQSGATLIVSPSSISFQWIQEIQKHVKHKVCQNNIPSGKVPNIVPHPVDP